MAYENIPGVRASYLDGAFKIPTNSAQPRILILGSAKSGRSYEIFNVGPVGEAEAEFGTDTEVLKGVHEALAQGADKVSVMRIGGTQGSVLITDSVAKTLTITPEYRDDTILERYTLIMDAAGRLLIYDLDDGQFVYDSDEEKVINSDIIRVVKQSGFAALVTGDIDDPANSIKLSDLVFDTSFAPDAASVVQTAGTDGTSMSLVERYAALNQAYHLLDYRDADIVVPMGVHLDDANQSDGTAVQYSGGVPTAGSTLDVLGFVWQYIYQGKLYTYFADKQDPAAVGFDELTHEDLTGDAIPAAVSTRFSAAVAAEFREVNFAHQLASFCYKASTTWKAMIGILPTKGPDAFDRISVSEWAGTLPTFTTIGLDLAIDSSGDNGSGLLGNKFLAGEAAYRDAQVEDGDSTDGLAYGGFILTVGASLPNGTDYPYGIDDDDEALDGGDKPIDLGKHILVTYDQPKHRNSFNGGSVYRGNLAASLAGRIAVTPENKEPIGDQGLMRRVFDSPRIHATLINDLAKIRMVGLRREDGVGLILVSVKTAAHPDSDYTRLSTIRSVNKVIQGIRDVAKKYIGSEFSALKLLSLQAAIDGFLVEQRNLGFHGGAKASLSYSRSDKILGKLKVKLRMVPPFAIEAIDIETSLAADESQV